MNAPSRVSEPRATGALTASAAPTAPTPPAALDVETALAACPIFADLDPGDRGAVAASAIVERFEAGDIIFNEGDPPEWLCIVVDGLVKLVKHSDDGRDIILHLAMPHDMLGGVSAFGRRSHPFTARAVTSTVVLRFAGPDYARIMESQPTVARRTLDDLIEQLTEAHEMMKSLAVERVERRVARQLLKLAARAGRTGNHGIEIDVPLTRQDLADLAGTTVESAIRVLSRWRAERIVEASGGRILVKDEGRLAEIAGR